MSEFAPQRSEAWIQQRLGRVTASRIADLMARTKTGYGASRANYMAELICERLTGVKQDGYTNAAMQWGIDNEAAARAAYSFYTDADVAEEGFILHPQIEDSGASPDGLVGSDGLVEIKCPNTASHIETLLSGDIAGKYLLQMQWQMACTGRQWCDFMSFDPRMPGDMQVWIKRVPRDEAKIAEIEAEVRKFLAEIYSTVSTLTAKYARAA